LLPLLGVTLALFLVPDIRPGDEIAPEDGSLGSRCHWEVGGMLGEILE